MKNAWQGGRGRLLGIGLAALTISMTTPPPAGAQQPIGNRFPAPQAGGQRTPGRPKTVDLRSAFSDVPGVKQVTIPVNPSDPIAVVNGQSITRQQLADECVAKEGKRVLDTMISRVLIEQAMTRAKMSITAAEIDDEINSIAQRFGLDRSTWLRTLDKERGISPSQYAREIVYPAIAMQKLCRSRVQVTPNDMREAFESQFGEKLRVRMIMVNSSQKAFAIWEQLRLNPGGFEVMAKEQSMDPGSKALGGLLAEPITRHSYPRTVSDGAFRDLVDGDPKDKDPSHKPKDGDITGVIQMGESSYIILRREGLEPADTKVNPKDEAVLTHLRDMLYDVKLKEQMEKLFENLIKEAEIENRLTGSIKMANEDTHPDHRVDRDVRLMGNKDSADAASAKAAQTPAPTGRVPAQMARPAALAPEVADQQFRPLKPVEKPSASKSAPSATPTTPAPAPTAGGGQ